MKIKHIDKKDIDDTYTNLHKSTTVLVEFSQLLHKRIDGKSVDSIIGYIEDSLTNFTTKHYNESGEVEVKVEPIKDFIDRKVKDFILNKKISTVYVTNRYVYYDSYFYEDCPAYSIGLEIQMYRKYSEEEIIKKKEMKKKRALQAKNRKLAKENERKQRDLKLLKQLQDKYKGEV